MQDLGGQVLYLAGLASGTSEKLKRAGLKPSQCKMIINSQPLLISNILRFSLEFYTQHLSDNGPTAFNLMLILGLEK